MITAAVDRGPVHSVDLSALIKTLEAPHVAQCESWHDREHFAYVHWRDECLQWLCLPHHSAPCPGCAMHDAPDAPHWNSNG